MANSNLAVIASIVRHLNDCFSLVEVTGAMSAHPLMEEPKVVLPQRPALRRMFLVDASFSNVPERLATVAATRVELLLAINRRGQSRGQV